MPFFIQGTILKKISIVFLMMIVLSCKSLMNPHEQPVYLIDSKNNIYMTTCSGMAETIGSCYQKALKTCYKGYRLIGEKLDTSGIERLIKFQCKV
jgi:hypothetical protein